MIEFCQKQYKVTSLPEQTFPNSLGRSHFPRCHLSGKTQSNAYPAAMAPVYAKVLADLTWTLIYTGESLYVWLPCLAEASQRTHY